MVEVDAFRSKDLRNRDLGRISCDLLHGTYAALQRNLLACFTIEDRIEDLHEKRVLVIVGYNDVVAVQEVLLHRSGCRLQCGDYLGIVGFAVVECRLILKDKKEPPCDRFPRADISDEVVVVLLKLPALGILLAPHVALDRVEMLADVCLLGQDLDLDLDGTDLHPAGERGDDILLFSHAPEEEVDRLHFKDFDVSAVCHVNDPVPDVFYGDQVFGIGLLASALPDAAAFFSFGLWFRALWQERTLSAFLPGLAYRNVKLRRRLVGAGVHRSLHRFRFWLNVTAIQYAPVHKPLDPVRSEFGQ